MSWQHRSGVHEPQLLGLVQKEFALARQDLGAVKGKVACEVGGKVRWGLYTNRRLLSARASRNLLFVARSGGSALTPRFWGSKGWKEEGHPSLESQRASAHV